MQLSSVTSGGLGLGGEQRQRRVDELLGGEIAVTGHVPQRQPHDRAGERIIETLQVRQGETRANRRRKRSFVYVRSSSFTRMNAGALLAGCGGDHGGFAVHVKLEAVGAHDLAGGRILVVEADREAMRAQHRVLGGGGLVERERGDGAVRVLLDLGGDRVDAGLLQPLGAPRLEIAAGRFSSSCSRSASVAWSMRTC